MAATEYSNADRALDMLIEAGTLASGDAQRELEFKLAQAHVYALLEMADAIRAASGGA